MIKTTTLGILALLVVLAIPEVSAAPSEYYLNPDNSSVPEGYCNTAEIAIWINATEEIRSGKITVSTVSLCGNITSCTLKCTALFPIANYVIDHPNQQLRIGYAGMVVQPAGKYHIANFTIHCNSTTHCTTDVVFLDIRGTMAETYAENDTVKIPTITNNGTFTGGTPPSAETFSKDLYEGWNLISLPLDPEDDTASAVLSGVSYDAVYRYNATATPKQFERIESTDAMNSGTGYFVHVTTDCTWKYDGAADTSIGTSLKHGLNMVGWLNCSKDVGDALSSISGDYYYIARWNASAQKFEVYNPAAPSTFNDFATMDRGTGYFISAKQDCALSENC